MKKYLLISIACLAIAIFTSIGFTSEFSAVTPDNEVASVNAVEVKETKAVETTYTLGQIDSIISTIQSRIARDQAFLSKYQALRTAVELEAKKVNLKAVEVAPVAK